MGNIFILAVCHGLNDKGLHDFEKSPPSGCYTALNSLVEVYPVSKCTFLLHLINFVKSDVVQNFSFKTDKSEIQLIKEVCETIKCLQTFWAPSL
jgi:hypothetical protein